MCHPIFAFEIIKPAFFISKLKISTKETQVPEDPSTSLGDPGENDVFLFDVPDDSGGIDIKYMKGKDACWLFFGFKRGTKECT